MASPIFPVAVLRYLLACSCYQKGGRFREAAQVPEIENEDRRCWGFLSHGGTPIAGWFTVVNPIEMEYITNYMKWEFNYCK